MWFDTLEPGKSWASLWYGYIRCSCDGIRTHATCTRCNGILDTSPQRFVDDQGHEFTTVPAFPGGEGRIEDWVLLAMIEREWRRDEGAHEWLDNIPAERRPSARANVVMLFWTYFETRIGRLLRAGLANVPTAIAEDWLERNWKVTTRMNQAYGVLFENRTYRADLEELGYGDVWQLLDDVRNARNAFTHGHPEAITDALVFRVVENLKREHEGWIAVFNRRAPRRRSV